MNILYCCDDGYAPLAGISMTSLFENNKDLDEINVYIAGLEISDLNRSKFEKTAKKYGRGVTIVSGANIDTYLREKDVRPWKGGYMTWWRLFLGRLLPEDVERALYLDCDTIVAGSLGELEEYRFEEGKACAQVRLRVCDGYNTLIGISEDAVYYQAGVMLIDVGRWREYGIEEKTMELLNDGYGVYPLPDQDFLSAQLGQYIQTLGVKYNLMQAWKRAGIRSYCRFHSLDSANFYSVEEIENAFENPIILHCFGIIASNVLPDCFEGEWLEYRAMSLWHDAYETRKGGTPLVAFLRGTVYPRLPNFISFRISQWHLNRTIVKEVRNLNRLRTR